MIFTETPCGFRITLRNESVKVEDVVTQPFEVRISCSLQRIGFKFPHPPLAKGAKGDFVAA
jgi:hypothetical protein